MPAASNLRPSTLALLAAVAFLHPASSLSSQAPAEQRSSDALRVYLECSGGNACDQREFRTVIDWVNWMRDRQDAQLHIIVTGQSTGSGGRSYQLDFIGLEELDGRDDQLGFTTLGTDVEDESVRGLTRVLGVGIARYSLLAGVEPPVDLVSLAEAQDAPTDRLVTAAQVDDPWDFWVFGLDFDLDLEGETSRRNRRVGGGFDASRTTTTWKFEFEAGGNWRHDEIRLSDSTIVDTRRDWDVEAALVYALADHWSIGSAAEASAATRTNQDLSVSLGPALEYSVWPYEETPRRSLRARYRAGVRYFDYEEVTLFGRSEELRPAHEVELSIRQRQPWGSVFAGTTASQFLHDPGKYRVSTDGSLSFRIVRGLELDVSAEASWIRDELFLAAEGASDEEILLERRRIASDFDWEIGLGISFQFGSIYNNVVNNRF